MTHALPSHAQEVWSGNLFKVYTWQQELFDGTTTTFETIVQEDGVLMIVVDQGKILLAKELQPHFDTHKIRLLGGRLPWGKDPLEHAHVELLEEAGMQSDDFQKFGACVMNGNYKRIRHYFIVKNPKIVAKQDLDPGGEQLEILYVSFEEFVDYVLHGGVGGLRLKCALQEMIIKGTLEEFRKSLFN